MLSDRYDGENAHQSIYSMPVYCHLANTFITFTLAERDKSKKCMQLTALRLYLKC